MKVEEFIEKFQQHAKAVYQMYQIPILVTLAQAALESGWGKSTPGNMVFGIKAKNWNGQKQLLKTVEYHNNRNVKYPKINSIIKISENLYKYEVYDYFRAYDNYLESFLDYGKLLRTNQRYYKAFSYSDPYKFAYEIAQGGYATSKSYYDKIVSIIDILKKKLKSVPGLALVRLYC